MERVKGHHRSPLAPRPASLFTGMEWRGEDEKSVRL
jgi:hypothetical protein